MGAVTRIAALFVLLAGPAAAGQTPAFPYLTWGATFTGSSSATSASVFADSEHITPNAATSSSVFLSHGPLTEWALSVNVTGVTNPLWVVEVQGSLDGLTWSRILLHRNQESRNGTIVWGPHRKVRQVRLAVLSVSPTGGHLAATAYAEP